MRISPIAALTVLLLATAPAEAVPPKGWSFVGYQEGMIAAKRSQKPVFLLFGQDPCPYCEELNAKTFSNPELRALYGKEYVLIYMDVRGLNEAPEQMLPDGTRLTHREFIRRHKAFVTPSWAFYNRDGVVVLRGAGASTSVQDFFDFHRSVSAQRGTQTSSEFSNTTNTGKERHGPSPLH